MHELVSKVQGACPRVFPHGEQNDSGLGPSEGAILPVSRGLDRSWTGF